MKLLSSAAVFLASALVVSGCTPVTSEAAKNRTFIPSTGNLRLADTPVAAPSPDDVIIQLVFPDQ